MLAIAPQNSFQGTCLGVYSFETVKKRALKTFRQLIGTANFSVGEAEAVSSVGGSAGVIFEFSGSWVGPRLFTFSLGAVGPALSVVHSVASCSFR